MRFFVLFACALAVASAGHVVAPLAAYATPQHLPIIGANGVPVDTAEVQIARAAHLAHKVDAHLRNGDYAIAHAPLVAHAAPLVFAHAPVVASAYTHHGLVAPSYPTTHIHPANIPLETPEVVAAKINHFAAHNEALARNVHAVHYIKRRGIYAAYATQHFPIIGANGVPVDTAEVQIARAAHLAHKVDAHVRNGDYAVAAPIVAHAAPIVAPAYAHAAPIVASTYAHAAPYAHHHAYAAPLAHHYL